MLFTEVHHMGNERPCCSQRCTIWGMKGHAVHSGWFRKVNMAYLFSCTEPNEHIFNTHNGTVLYLSNMFWYYCAIFREFLNKTIRYITFPISVYVACCSQVQYAGR